MDLGLVDGGSVLREASPTTTSPETSSVAAVRERRAFFHQRFHFLASHEQQPTKNEIRVK